MIIDIMGLKINYIQSGKGNNVLVLHGWGASIDAVRPITKLLERNFCVTAVDLPGFGKSQEPSEAWDVYTYADFVKEFTQKLGITNPIIIGHSFGGRLSIILSAKKMLEINKLILVDSAGVLPKRGIEYYTKVYTYKAMKKILNVFPKSFSEKLKSKAGSSDYKNASEIMKKIMVKVVNEDLTYLFKDVKASTLLIWGEKDDATPLSDGKLMEKLIPDAGLVVLSGAGHYSYIDKYPQFAAVVNKFLENNIVR